uniref:Cj0814 family flagellar-dependent secreted protein n=1 Tax=uncultured Campylobacter sp. TaxID=218934 RepID=UPI00341C94F2
LGYGVDSEGFFTSDFNEAAGLPKDFKIYAEDALAFKKEEEVNRAGYMLSFYNEIDFAKSIGNAYKVFSQLIQNKGSFSNEDLKDFAYAYSVDKNLNITKKYSKEEYISLFDKNSTDGAYLSFSTLEMNPLKFNDINEDSIFDKLIAKLDKNVYKDSDGKISKGGLLTAFMNSNAFYLYAEGNSNIQGKFFGYDNNVDKYANTSFI